MYSPFASTLSLIAPTALADGVGVSVVAVIIVVVVLLIRPSNGAGST